MMDFSAQSDKIKVFFEDEQKKLYVTVGGVAVIVVLYLTFLMLPTYNNLSETTRSVKDLTHKIGLVESREKRFDEMTCRLNALKEEQGQYVKQLPDEKDIPSFLEGLASMAKESNVKILSVTPQPFTTKGLDEETVKYFREMPIVITAKSGYHQLGQFINKLEQGERFTEIQDLFVQYDGKYPRAHNVRIVLKAYVAVENE